MLKSCSATSLHSSRKYGKVDGHEVSPLRLAGKTRWNGLASEALLI